MVDISDLLVDGYDILNETDLIDSLRESYRQIRAAILELAKGERVASVTISGKTTIFAQTDLPALRTLRDEYATELRSLLNTNQPKCYRTKTSSGF